MGAVPTGPRGPRPSAGRRRPGSPGDRPGCPCRPRSSPARGHHDRPAQNDRPGPGATDRAPPAVGQGQQAERDHRRDQGRVLARHRPAGQQAEQQPPADLARADCSRPDPKRRPDQGGVVEAERPLDVGDHGQAVDPGRRQVDDRREPGRAAGPAAPGRRGDQHRGRRGEERHQELPDQAAPPPVAQHLHAQQVEHLHAERHVRVDVVRQEGDPPGLVVLLRPLEVVLEHVEVDRRQHRAQEHDDQERGDDQGGQQETSTLEPGPGPARSPEPRDAQPGHGDQRPGRSGRARGRAGPAGRRAA